MADSSETVIKDRQNRVLGGNKYDADVAVQVLDADVAPADAGDQATRALISDDDDGRVLMGKRADGSKGLFVSLVTKDVRTATLDELIMSSNHNMIKIVGYTELTLTQEFAAVNGPASGYQVQSVVHNHNLGYVPSFLTWGDTAEFGRKYNTDTTYRVAGGVDFDTVNGRFEIWTNLYGKVIVDTTKVTLYEYRYYEIENGQTMPAKDYTDFDYKIYLFRETAN